MKAWGESLDPDKSSNIRFLADPSGAFTRAFDMEFESAQTFGQNRSKRYAVTVENGLVKDVFVEPDNTGVTGKRLPLTVIASPMLLIRWRSRNRYRDALTDPNRSVCRRKSARVDELIQR